MPRRAPRPRLRDGVGRGAAGRSGELAGALVELEGFDLPVELGAAGRLAWLQFAANPMPWWTDADLSTVAQYCSALDVLDAARSGPVYAWAAANREVRSLADALGLTPMARARLGLKKGPGVPRSPLAAADEPREPIPVDVLLGDLPA